MLRIVEKVNLFSFQTEPNNGGSNGGSYENYKAAQSLGLGITQIVIGLFCITFTLSA